MINFGATRSMVCASCFAVKTVAERERTILCVIKYGHVACHASEFESINVSLGA